jgi:hypothetical protein
VLVNGDRLPGQAVPPAALLDLPPPAANRHRVVLVHYTLGLHRKHKLQILSAAPTKRRPPLLRSYRKVAVEFRYVPLPQKLIGPLQAPDARHPQLLRQPVLPSPEVSL